MARSPWGRVLKSIRDDEAVSISLGKDAFHYKVQSLILGSSIAALSGSLLAFYLQYINPMNFQPVETFYAWIIVIMGGSGNNRGTIIGAMLLWGFFSGTRFVDGYLSFSPSAAGATRMTFIGAMLVAFMMFRPRVYWDERRSWLLSGEILSVKEARKGFGGILAVDGCSLTVNEGTIVGLIGPNGAGKSTLFDLISGFVRPDRGSIVFRELEIVGLPAHKIARLGLIRTFQIPRALTRMTVLENMKLGAQGQTGESIYGPIVRWHRVQAEEKRIEKKAEDILKFFDLLRMKDEYAGSLSGGQKKVLEMARPLMADPKLLLLDDPFAGVNPSLSDRLLERIKTLREKGLTIMIIEHSIPYVLALSDEVYVLNKGSVLAHGLPEEFISDKRVFEAYLGVGLDAQP